ncbi:MAG: ABC transporter ATP-binding protein [Firmicutes bacterium]|nr:ABC transporter ATP-binding protein [Bacillota bacterium]
MPGPGQAPGKMSKPRNTKKTFKRLLSYLGDYKPQLVLVFIGILGSTASSVAGTYLLRPLLNNYIVPLIGKQNPDLTGFIHMIGIMITVYVMGILCSLMYTQIMVRVSSNILKTIRTQLFTHMQDLPIRYYDTHTHGELMSRYTTDTDTLREMLSMGLPQLIAAAVSMISVLVMMFIISVPLALIVIGILVVMILCIRTIGGRSGKLFVEQQRNLGKLNGYVEEMTEGLKVVKIFSREQILKDDFEGINEDLRQTAKKANTLANILMPIMGNLSYITYSIVAMVGALLVIGGTLDIGAIGSFLQYTRTFSMPVSQISQLFNSILNALAGAERIFNLIDEEPEVDEGRVTMVFAREAEDGTLTEIPDFEGVWAWKVPLDDEGKEFKLVKIRGDVRFEDVTFGYKENKTVLHHVSLYAKPGQKIAFVGSTGAGKTTITNLINRFYDTNSGSITYDGIPIKDIKKADLRKSLAMVLQDTHLFTGTIMENIRYGRLSATDEEVMTAAKLANADSFIHLLPDGYQTVISGDGANLSQGQRQLLAIARAAVANPPVLILDEATSSVDTRTESLIEKGMNKLMQGRTVFVIAHRLSTVKNANAILVVEDGQIIERGDHDDLLKQRGRYYQLYTGMFELT